MSSSYFSSYLAIITISIYRWFIQCIQLIFPFTYQQQNLIFGKSHLILKNRTLYTSAGQSHKRKLCFKQDIPRQKSTRRKVTFQSNFKFQDDNTKFLNLPATNINVTLQSSGLSNAKTPKYWVGLSNPRHQNAGLVSSGVSNISWREGVSLALPYGVEMFYYVNQPHTRLLLMGWLQLNLKH